MTHRNSSTIANVAVLTVSDSRHEGNDVSGDMICGLLAEHGHELRLRGMAPDDVDQIQGIVQSWLDEKNVNVIIVTGGTGASKRDVTPEALLPMCATCLSGFGELFRQLSFGEIGASSMLSRADAGLLDGEEHRVPLFLLPGSPQAVKLAVEQIILPQIGHLVDLCHEGTIK